MMKKAIAIIVCLLITSSAYAFFVGFGSSNGVDQVIKKGQQERTIPAIFDEQAPTELIATRVTSGRVDLSWKDRCSNEDGYEIERKVTGGSFSRIAIVGVNITEYADMNVAGNLGYSYRVRAYNGKGVSIYSNETDASAFQAPTATPTPVVGSAAVIIYSVVASPTDQEAITLKNNGTVDANISNWTLGDLNNPTAYSFPNGTTLPAGNTLTIPRTTLGFQINDSGETIYLRDNTGVTIDTWSN